MVPRERRKRNLTSCRNQRHTPVGVLRHTSLLETTTQRNSDDGLRTPTLRLGVCDWLRRRRCFYWGWHLRFPGMCILEVCLGGLVVPQLLPIEPFNDLLADRHHMTELVHWYNHEHRHSAIRFVTPEQRHCSSDRALLANRDTVFQRARLANPSRWSKQTRNWHFIDSVHLNPDRQKNKAPEKVPIKPQSHPVMRQPA